MTHATSTMWAPTRRGLLAAAAIAMLISAPMLLQAQPSTSRVQPVVRQPEIEIAVGRELLRNDPYLGDTCNGCRKAAVAASAHARWAMTPNVGVRGDARWVQRTGTSFAGGRVSDKLLAIGAAVDLRLPVYRSISVSPSLGGALVPYAATTRPFAEANGSGALVTAGLAVRVGRFALTQQVLILNGADRTIRDNREYYPLMIGWTF